MNVRAWLSIVAVALGQVAGVAALAQLPPGPPGSNAAPGPKLFQVRGAAVDLALTPRGDAYALDASGKLYLQSADNRDGNWIGTGGGSDALYSAVRATLDGSIWGIGLKGGALYRLDRTIWRGMASDVRDVTALPDGLPIVLTTEGKLQTVEREPRTFELSPEFANPLRLVSDQHGLLWFLYEDGRLARFNGVQLEAVPPPPGGAASFAIDPEGVVVAVSRSGAAFERNPQTKAWGEIYPGTKYQRVTIGPGGKPWFISADQRIFASQVFSQTGPVQVRTPSAFTRMLSWKRMQGQSQQVSVAEDGTVLRLDLRGGLSRWNKKDNWTPMPGPGPFVKVAAQRANAAWAIDQKGLVFRAQGTSWAEARATALDIAAGPRDSVWIVQEGGSLARWDAKLSQWERLRESAPPAAAVVAVGREGEPWIIGTDGVVRGFQRDGKWADYPGIAAVSLGVGPEGTVYATTSEFQLFWLDSREKQWKPATGKVRKVAVGAKGAPWMIDERDDTFASSMFTSENEQRDTTPRTASTTSNSNTGPGPGPTPGVFGSTSPSAFVTSATTGVTIMASTLPAPKRTALTFETLAGTFQDVGIGSNGTVFAAGTDGGLFCFSNPDKRFVFATSGQARRVAVTPAGTPWVVSASGEISRFEGGAWKAVPGFKAQDVSIGSAGVVVSVGLDGFVYRFLPDDNRFDRITLPASVASLQGVTRAAREDSGGVLWAVTSSQQLLRCDRGTTCESQSIGAQDVSLAPDNTVFVIDKVGAVQRYNQARKAFEPQLVTGVSVAGTSMAVGPQGLPWLVAAGGRVSIPGLFNVSNKLINPPTCAAPFLQQAAAPAPAPVAAGATVTAAADSATVNPGGTLNLLANDRLNGAVPTAAQVSINFTAQNPALLSQANGVLTVSASAVLGSTLTGSYTICALTGNNGACASANVTIAVGTPTVPGAPTGVAALAGNASAAVAFIAPASNGGRAITSYQVKSNDGKTATGTASPITVTGLVNGTPYTFTVTATNEIGTGAASAASNTVTPSSGATVPGAPTGATAFTGDASALVDFVPPASNGGSAITSYTVTSSPGGITGVGPINPILVSGLTNGTPYTFTVTATNAVGTGAASTASNSVTPVPVPTAPTILSVVANNLGNPATELLVTFNVPGVGAPFTSFTVTAADTVLLLPPFVTVGAGSPIVITVANTANTHTVTVTATNASGTGPPDTFNY